MIIAIEQLLKNHTALIDGKKLYSEWHVKEAHAMSASVIKSYEDTNDQLHKLVEELDAKVAERDGVIKTYMESTDDYHKVIKEQAERIAALESKLSVRETNIEILIEQLTLSGIKPII